MTTPSRAEAERIIIKCVAGSNDNLTGVLASEWESLAVSIEQALDAARKVPEGWTGIFHKSGQFVAAFQHEDVARTYRDLGYRIGAWSPEEVELIPMTTAEKPVH